MNTLNDSAIQATLSGNWKQAIEENLRLIKQNPTDVEAMNRLAFAYTMLGKLIDAKKLYRKVLKIDSANPIAQKHLKRLGDTSSRKVTSQSYHITAHTFLEESGKTKVITLVNPAQSRTLRTLQVGQPVILTIKRHKIFVLNEAKQFLGMLPDNVSMRLIKFMQGGNTYEACIKSIQDKDLMIFVRETKRAGKFKSMPSFPLSDIPRQILDLKKKSQDDDDESEA